MSQLGICHIKQDKQRPDPLLASFFSLKIGTRYLNLLFCALAVPFSFLNTSAMKNTSGRAIWNFVELLESRVLFCLFTMFLVGVFEDYSG